MNKTNKELQKLLDISDTINKGKDDLLELMNKALAANTVNKKGLIPESFDPDLAHMLSGGKMATKRKGNKILQRCCYKGAKWKDVTKGFEEVYGIKLK